MSNSTVASLSAVPLSSGTPFAHLQTTRRAHGHDEDSRGSTQGLNLFSALLQALVSAATQTNTGSATTADPPTPTSSDAISPNASSSATTSPGDGAASNSVPQDLGAFLHDLFHALRQAGRQESDARHLQPLSSAVGSSAQSTPTAASSGATTAASTPAATTASNTSSSATSGNIAVSRYRNPGIIGALQQLIQDLSVAPTGSATSATTPATGGVSAHVISGLNNAFQRLIADLGGTSGSADASDTSALKNFLQGFLQDLQNGGASSGSGNLVNATT